MSRNRQRQNQQKKDITIMTLLAYEATDDARKLLKKYANKDASNYKDLELKLSEMYLSSDRKPDIEKEMASMHPHKKWLMRLSEPVKVVKEEVKVSEIKPEDSKDKKKEEVVHCACGDCERARVMSSMKFSNFDGGNESKTVSLKQDNNVALIAISALALTAIVALTITYKKS